MSYNGSGTFSIINTFVYDTVISETDVNTNFSDIATGLSTAITKDGQTTITANIPFASNKITGLGSGTAATDASNLGQVQAQAYIWCGTAGGTADAITLSPSPAITAYAAGQTFRWKAGSSANTGAMTVAISGLATIAAQSDLSSLAAGDHEANAIYEGTLDTTSTIQIQKIALSTGYSDPLTTRGDLVYRDASATTRLAIGGANTVLRSDGTDAAWGDIAVADLATGTDGELITWDANGDPATVAAGTSGQVLTSNGAGAAPTFQDAAGSGWEFVSTSTASASATVAFTGFASGYDYLIEATGVLPATDNIPLLAELGISGPTYRTSGYHGLCAGIISTGTSLATGGALSSNIRIAPNTWGNAADENGGFSLEIRDPAAATDTYFTGTMYMKNDQGLGVVGQVGGHHETAEAMDAIQFYFSSGNISTGTFKLYRRANA